MRRPFGNCQGRGVPGEARRPASGEWGLRCRLRQPGGILCPSAALTPAVPRLRSLSPGNGADFVLRLRFFSLPRLGTVGEFHVSCVICRMTIFTHRVAVRTEDDICQAFRTTSGTKQIFAK